MKGRGRNRAIAQLSAPGSSRWGNVGKQRSQAKLGLFLPTLCLTALLIVGSGLPSLSQNSPAPSPPQSQQELIERVKQRANLDAEIGDPKKPDSVVETYRDTLEKLGVDEGEIKRIYAATYDQKIKDKNNSIETLLDTLPKGREAWLVAILAIGLAILKDTFVKTLEKAVAAINHAFYQHFSGNPLLWGLALKKYKAELAEKYQKLDIPFRPNNRPLKMAERYVPLNVSSSSASKQVDASRAIAQAKRLMITGEPGSGKTMLLKIIALRYAQGKLGLPDDPVVILLDLNRLGDALRGSPNPLEIIEQELVLALSRNDFPNASEFVKQRLANQSNQKGTIMLLLDGLDEVSSSDRPQVGKHLTDFLDTYEACRAVITCRTQVYRGEFSGIVQQTLNIEELSDQKIRQFLQPWEKEMPPDKSVDELLLQLRDRPEIKKLAQNPLLLTIIAFLYTDTPFVLPHSRAEFYDKSTNVLLETLDQARQLPNQYKAFTKRLLLKHLALYAQDSAKQRGADSRSLDYLKDVLPQTKKVLPSLNLDAEKDAEPILDEIVDRSGLLVKIDGGARYQFTHLTLQEFFAAEQLLEDPQGLIDRFTADPGAWREVLKLWCGRVNDSTEVIRQVYENQPLAAFQGLADAQKIDPSLAKNIIANFKTRLGDPNQPPGMEKAFGLVASDTRPSSRGREVFQYLVDTLNSAQTSSMQKLAAMDALSRTNLIKAAQELSKHYQDSTEIRQIMVRMGDLAVPSLLENARESRPFALDDLMQIGTPDSAAALAECLWHRESAIAGKAAWLFAALLPRTGIEEGLPFKEEKIQEKKFQQTAQENWNWAWDPFKHNDPSDSVFARIVGRTMYLLETTPTPETTPDHLDPRLLIPLCAFSQKLKPQGNRWTSDMDRLLEATRQNSKPKQAFVESELDQQSASEKEQSAIKQTIDRLLPDQAIRSHWGRLLSGVPALQLDLLKRLMKSSPQPSKRDWKDLFRSVEYSFATSWQFRLIVMVAMIVSIVAVGSSINILSNHPEWLEWIVLSLLIIAAPWALCLKESRGRFDDPSLFFQFGIGGWLTFLLNLRHLRKPPVVWAGAEKLRGLLLNSQTFSLSFVGMFLGIIFLIADGGRSGVSIVGRVMITSALAVITAAIGTGSTTFILERFGSRNPIFPSIMLIALLIVLTTLVIKNVPNPLLAFATIFSIGVGLSFWVRAKATNDIGKFGMILTYPLFWSAPIIFGYTTYAIYGTFQTIGCIVFWTSLAVGGTILWQRGSNLDRLARNPFQKIPELEPYNLHNS